MWVIVPSVMYNVLLPTIGIMTIGVHVLELYIAVMTLFLIVPTVISSCQVDEESKANISIVHPNNGSDRDSGVDENVVESPISVSNSEDAGANHPSCIPMDKKHNA